MPTPVVRPTPASDHNLAALRRWLVTLDLPHLSAALEDEIAQGLSEVRAHQLVMWVCGLVGAQADMTTWPPRLIAKSGGAS